MRPLPALFAFSALAAFSAFSAFPKPVLAAPPLLTYKYGEQIFEIRPSRYTHWQRRQRTFTFRGIPILLPEERTAPGNLPKGVEVHERMTWNLSAIAESLESIIGTKINQEAREVRIKRDSEGQILFEGAGIPGRKLNANLAAHLTVTALEEEVPTIILPVEETPPRIIVEDEALAMQGIRKLVAIGESDFSGSPANRRQNIAIGLGKFNGHLIEEGEEFSFNEVLGPVNAKEGYRKELTILGERTIPDFGGGLCQVSTTAYRGVWKAGFPILDRRNHSFAVIYYAPPGTDATIFPPWTDMRFQNDSPGTLLIQTLVEGNKAYFLYYGTPHEDRTVDLIGPFTWDVREPPEDRTMYTTEIPSGETRIVSKAVRGMRTMWYRSLTFADGREEMESFFSYYEARPNIEEIGVTSEESEIMPDFKGEDR